MQMWTGRVAGAADLGDFLAAPHCLSLLNLDTVNTDMGVEGPKIIAVIDYDRVSVPAPPFGDNHDPVIGSPNFGAFLGRHVHAVVFLDIPRYRVNSGAVIRRSAPRQEYVQTVGIVR